MKSKQKKNTLLKQTGSKKVGIKPIRFRQSLFWDVDPKTIDPKRHARYIIERILEFGNDDEVRWMAHYYSPVLIKDVVYRSRGVLCEKTKALWSLLYPMPKE